MAAAELMSAFTIESSVILAEPILPELAEVILPSSSTVIEATV